MLSDFKATKNRGGLLSSLRLPHASWPLGRGGCVCDCHNNHHFAHHIGCRIVVYSIACSSLPRCGKHAAAAAAAACMICTYCDMHDLTLRMYIAIIDSSTRRVLNRAFPSSSSSSAVACCCCCIYCLLPAAAACCCRLLLQTTACAGKTCVPLLPAAAGLLP